VKSKSPFTYRSSIHLSLKWHTNFGNSFPPPSRFCTRTSRTTSTTKQPTHRLSTAFRPKMAHADVGLKVLGNPSLTSTLPRDVRPGRKYGRTERDLDTSWANGYWKTSLPYATTTGDWRIYSKHTPSAALKATRHIKAMMSRSSERSYKAVLRAQT
jgi:hypothetical protein